MPKWLCDKGNGVQCVVQSEERPEGKSIKLKPGPLFTDDETLYGVFPEILPDASSDKS